MQCDDGCCYNSHGEEDRYNANNNHYDDSLTQEPKTCYTSLNDVHQNTETIQAATSKGTTTTTATAVTADAQAAATTTTTVQAATQQQLQQQQLPLLVVDDDNNSQTNNNNNDEKEKNIVVRNLGIPDIDDTSMKYVNNYMEYYNNDIYWSTLSDIFFILGGVLYVILAISDLLLQQYKTSVPGYYNITLSYNSKIYYIIKHILEGLAPLVYVFNSIIDIQWAFHIKQRIRIKRQMQQEWNDWGKQNTNYYNIIMQQQQQQTLQHNDDFISNNNKNISNDNNTKICCFADDESFNDEEEQDDDDDDCCNNNNNCCCCCCYGSSKLNKLRKHAAHRRTIMAAFTFGIAASFGFLAVVGDMYIFESISAHCYILSAIIAITGKRTRPWFAIPTYNNNNNTTTMKHEQQKNQHCLTCKLFLSSPETMEDVGDLLFLVGSVLDALLLDLDLEEPYIVLLQSTLWLIDACFYLRADHVMIQRQRKDIIIAENNNNNNKINDDSDGRIKDNNNTVITRREIV